VIIVSNTSPLCNLAIAEHLWILHQLYQTIIIPQVVADELGQARAPEIQMILALEWIEIRTLSNTTLAETLERDRYLDPGEAHAIALAVELNANELLMDERLGRQAATELGIPIVGILDILRVAKLRGLITTVKPILDRLINDAQFRVAKPLYEQILQDVGE
jgi:predicted nucleic acid-binding protein